MPRSQTPPEGLAIVVERLKALKPKLVLDVGAGDGMWDELLAEREFDLHALEVWEPNVKKYDLANKYEAVIVKDMRMFTDWELYDVVIMGDVLEHIEQDQALFLLRKITVPIFLTIPTSPCKQDGKAWGNPHETHRYNWSHGELNILGFQRLHVGHNPNDRVEISCYERKAVWA